MEKINLETIERWMKDDDRHVRMAAMYACAGRDIPFDIIECGLKDDEWQVREMAMCACAGRDITLDVIEQGLKDDDWRVRRAAMCVCAGRDIPLDIIERWMKDDNWRVRTEAMKACKRCGYAVPVIRTIEPPERVYKKCLSGVIVVAEIPKDAQVRGTINGECRADKAKIVEIIGEFAGEKVGVSSFDYKMYFVGDDVVVDNFDYSNEECSTGFHFFCTREQAERY